MSASEFLDLRDKALYYRGFSYYYLSRDLVIHSKEYVDYTSSAIVDWEFVLMSSSSTNEMKNQARKYTNDLRTERGY